MKKINILLLFLFSVDIFSVGEVFVINDYKDMDRIINFPNTDKYKVIVAVFIPTQYFLMEQYGQM